MTFLTNGSSSATNESLLGIQFGTVSALMQDATVAHNLASGNSVTVKKLNLAQILLAVVR